MLEFNFVNEEKDFFSWEFSFPNEGEKLFAGI